MHHPATTASIQQLLDRSADANSPWRLAIVQRERVWTPARAAKLLDIDRSTLRRKVADYEIES